MTTKVLFLALLTATGSLLRAELTFSSGPAQTHLLELYTSEGCSSCPPAEAWLSQRKGDARLWRDYVPVAFHVDYWNRLGWPDRFSSPALTERQRRLAATWGSGTVYTPGFVLDGSEWRRGDSPAAQGNGGTLRVSATGEKLLVNYTPPTETTGPWEAHAAVLLMNQETDVRAGENEGRDLRHDFVAKEILSAPLDTAGQAAVDLPLSKGQACAVWITKRGDLRPVQAAGGWWQ